MEEDIQFENIYIHYKDCGKGIPVVLLHGYLESGEIWNTFTNELKKFFRVICIDIPGHGKSGVMGEIHTMEKMAEAVKQVLDNLKIKECILIGHSMGGYITLAFLELFPQYLKAFSLFHSSPFADNDEKKQNRDREIDLIKKGKKEVVYTVNIPRMFADDNIFRYEKEIKEALKIAKNIPDDGIVALLNGMKERKDRLQLIQDTKIPFLLVLGKKDNYISYDLISEKLGIPRCVTKLVLENSGHIGFIEEKEKSYLGIRRFIESL